MDCNGRGGGGDSHSLTCNQTEIPLDETNLILKAARLFDTALEHGNLPPTRFRTTPRRVHFTLDKRIPMGAGLGGGSSNGVAALRALNSLYGYPFPDASLTPLAAQLGSDCPLFLQDRPVIMRGRGERVEPLPPSAVNRLRGRQLLVFKPPFSVATPWAYRRMVERGGDYLAPDNAEARLADWLAKPKTDAMDLLYNNMEPSVFEKYAALPALLERLRNHHHLVARMSGSGSACFALLETNAQHTRITAAMSTIRESWGPETLCIKTDIG